MTQIFIDESGIFNHVAAENKPWHVVGSLAVGEKHLEEVARAVEALSADVGLAPSAEVKGTKVQRDKHVLAFIERLKLADPVFVPAIVYLDEAKASVFDAVAEHDRELPQGDKRALESKTLQNYIQSNVLLDLLNATLWGSVLHFSRTDASSLRSFKWVVDDKAIVKDFVSAYLEDFIVGYGNNFTHTIKPSSSMDLGPFYQANGALDMSAFSPKKVFGDFGFYDSKSHPGLMAVDVLSNAFRRCLRKRWDDSDAVAMALASLMVDQKPYLTVKARKPGVSFNSTILPISDKFKLLTAAEHPIVERLRNNLPERLIG